MLHAVDVQRSGNADGRHGEINRDFQHCPELVVGIMHQIGQILNCRRNDNGDVMLVTPLCYERGVQETLKGQHIIFSRVFGNGGEARCHFFLPAMREQINLHRNRCRIKGYRCAFNDFDRRVSRPVDGAGGQRDQRTAGLCYKALLGIRHGCSSKVRLGELHKQLLQFGKRHTQQYPPFPSARISGRGIRLASAAET